MAMKRSLIAAFAILACLMFAWATGAGRPYPASAGGVIDPTCTSSSPCIEYDNNGTGQGIKGVSLQGHGVTGFTLFKSTSPTSFKAGVIGNDQSASGNFDVGVFGKSVRGTGAYGSSTSGVGTSGTSANNDGVYGASTSYVGVYGKSTGYLGVFGTGPTYGVAGSTSGSGAGVYGTSTNGVGVLGTATSGVGVNAVGGGFDGTHEFPALSIVGNMTGINNNDLIDACSPGTANPCDELNSVFRVDGFGRVIEVQVPGTYVTLSGGFVNITGQYQINGFCEVGCAAATTTSAGRAVVTYAPQSSQPMIEDNGEAQLVNGEAHVRVDPAFANVINQRTVYSVSLTPEGDSNGLFVTQKTLTGFIVHENHGGRSTLAFEYRIVAKPFGSTAKRLPMVDTPLRRAVGARSGRPGGVVPVR
jgi:hypothetical protein